MRITKSHYYIGQISVLPNHIPIAIVVDIGILRIHSNN